MLHPNSASEALALGGCQNPTPIDKSTTPIPICSAPVAVPTSSFWALPHRPRRSVVGKARTT
jgi:hypothetical protein